MNGTVIGKTLLLVAGLFVFHVLLAGARHLEIVRLGQWSKYKCRLEIRNDWLAHHLKRTTKKLRTPCACKVCSKPAMEDILECIWYEGFQHRECTKISADVCNALSSVIDNIVFFILPVYNYFQLH